MIMLTDRERAGLRPPRQHERLIASRWFAVAVIAAAAVAVAWRLL